MSPARAELAALLSARRGSVWVDEILRERNTNTPLVVVGQQEPRRGTQTAAESLTVMPLVIT
jgi:hypothetical protein